MTIPHQNRSPLVKPFFSLFSLLTFALLSCSDNQGEHVLTESQMVEVLYDYQMAGVLAQQSHPDEPSKLLSYRQAVFYKHHISEEEFNRSLAHYSRHPKQMKAVYDGLARHYNLQSTTAAIANAGKTVSDTLLIWEKQQYTLSGSLQNRLILELPFPYSKKSIESLRLSFLSNNFYHEGTPQVVASIGVVYDNDSVGTTSTTLSLYQPLQVVNNPLSTMRKPRNVRIELFQTTGWTPTPQVISLQKLRLQGIPLSSTSNQP